MRAGLAGSLTVVVAISTSCGGRFVTGDEDGAGDATGVGGSSSLGAATGRGATSSAGARSSFGGAVGNGGKATGSGGRSAGAGGKGTGGTLGVAGTTSSGGGCACPIIECAPDYRLVRDAVGCCFHCESKCDSVICPELACGSGSHLERFPGECCQTCVSDSCAVQHDNYATFRQQLVDKYSTLGCMVNGDCTVYYEQNQCAQGCGIPMPSAAISSLDDNLRSFANVTCSPRCMIPIPPCELPFPPSCFKGSCE